MVVNYIEVICRVNWSICDDVVSYLADVDIVESVINYRIDWITKEGVVKLFTQESAVNSVIVKIVDLVRSQIVDKNLVVI